MIFAFFWTMVIGAGAFVVCMIVAPLWHAFVRRPMATRLRSR
jgi:hypothetical protein